MRFWTFVSSAHFRTTMLVLAAMLLAHTTQAQSYRLLEQLSDGEVIARPADVQDNVDGIDPTTHHMLFGAPTRRTTAQILWLSHDEPIVHVQKDADNEQYEMVLAARIPHGGDILYQAWSYSEDRLIDQFAHVRSSQKEGWGLDQARLQDLPPGSYEIQAIIRVPGRTYARAVQRVEVLAEGTIDFDASADAITRADQSETGDESNAQRALRESSRRPFFRLPGKKIDRGGPDADPADHNWPLNDNGFTSLPLRDGGRIIYVSAAGNDGNNGLTPQTPVLTPRRGFELMRHNRPDQLRFRAGDTFTAGMQHWTKSGRSAEQPMVIGVYGEGARPRFVMNEALFHTLAGNNRDQRVSNLAIQGLHLTNARRDPNLGNFNPHAEGDEGINWLGLGKNILIEDCIIEYFRMGLVFQSPNPRSEGDEMIENLTIRRNIIRYSWSSSIDASGGFLLMVKNGILEENLFDHNGWLPESYGVEGAVRDARRHNMYLAPRPNDPDRPAFPWTVRGNIFARASSHGMKGGPGGTVENNIWVHNAIGFYVSRNNSTIRGNIVIQGDDLDPDVGALRRGWGIEAFGMSHVTVENNIIANRVSESHGHALKMYTDTVNYTGNIIHNWNYTDDFNGDPDEVDYITNATIQDGGGNRGHGSSGTYVDPTRDLGSYHAALGKPATLESFLATAGARPRNAWDPNYAQPGIDAYIREGFQLQDRR